MPHHYRVDFMLFMVNKIRQCLLCITVSLCALPAPAVEVIVNSITKDLSIDQNSLRSIFSLRKRVWSNGEKIRIFVLPDNNTIHKKFVKEKLQMFPHQLRRTWNRMTYTGTGQPPVTVDSVSEMLEKIKTTPNSIGYIDRRIEDEAIHYFSAQ